MLINDYENQIFLGSGKKGEVFFFDPFHYDIGFIPLICEHQFNYSWEIIDDIDLYSRLIESDINIITYTFDIYLLEYPAGIFNDFNLSGLTAIPKYLFPFLKSIRGFLDLSGITELSDEAAAALSYHEGILDLQSLKEISPSGLSYLVNHKGVILHKNDIFLPNIKSGVYIIKPANEVGYGLVKLKSNNKSLTFIYDMYSGTSIKVIINNLYVFNFIDFLEGLGLTSQRQIIGRLGFEYDIVSNTREAINEFRKNNITENQRFYLGDDIYKIHHEEFLDDDSGQIISFDRPELFMSLGKPLTEENIELLISEPSVTEICLVKDIGYQFTSCISSLNTIEEDTSAKKEKWFKLTGCYRVFNDIDDLKYFVKDYLLSEFIESENFSFNGNLRPELKGILFWDTCDENNTNTTTFRIQDIFEITRYLILYNESWDELIYRTS